jgi:glycosyltransferase involved in cell wall biosynthesis
MWMTVIIPSLGRRDVLHDTVLSLDRQSRKADEILISIVNPKQDVLPETLKIGGVRMVIGPKGSVCQRNTALDVVHADCDLIAFLDDDIELDRNYLRNCCQFMSQHHEIAGISGDVLADGGIDRNEAIRIVGAPYEPCGEFVYRVGFYCSITVRRIVAQKCRFDTRLLNYGLYEDFDFGVRCARFGLLATVMSCRIVHLAVQIARESSKRLGYVQVMNSYYLWRKGSFSLWRFLANVSKSVIGNIVGIVVVKRGMSRKSRCLRLQGNVIGFWDIAVFGAKPERVEKIR